MHTCLFTDVFVPATIPSSPCKLFFLFFFAGAALGFPGLNLKPVPKAEPLDKSILKDELGFISIGSQTYK